MPSNRSTRTVKPPPLASRGPGYTALAAIAAALLLQFSGAVSAQATPPGPMTWTFGYDAEGNPKTITNPNGGVTQHTYDSLNRRRTTTQPLPATGVPRPVILMDYDGRDQLSRVQDPRNLATTYTTDGLGNVTSIQSPDSGVTTFTHDAAGNPITRTDARGVTHTYTYDDLNRLTRIDYPTGTATVYEYDGGPGGVVGLIGRLTKITDESGSTTYGYNGFGDVTSKTQVVNSAAGSRTFTVTTTIGETGIVTGKPTRITYPSGTHVDIGYEYAGRPGSITVTRNGTATVLLSGVTYNALHALSGWTWGDGTTYQRTFDSFLRLSTYPLGNPNGTGAAKGLTRTLSYDNTGNVTGYLHSGQPGFDQGHSYDGLDRLVQTLKSNSRYGYRYDATGNRITREIGADSYTHTVEAASNRLVNVQEPSGGNTATRTYSYDAMGNLTGDGLNTFVYSARGRMSRADTPNGSVSYLVNGLEQRMSKMGLTVPTGATYYVYDEVGHTIGEYDANGTPLYEVIYLRGIPTGIITAAGISYVYSDHLDTPRVITRNSDHAIVWRWDDAEAFGATPPNEDPNGQGVVTFNQRFPGQVFDRETGLFYNINRDYRPSDGRYVQADPIGFDGGYLTLYTYTGGNPTGRIDPTGLMGFGGGGAATYSKPVMGKIPKAVCEEDECRDPITISVGGGYCAAGDTMCAAGMQAAGLQGPYYYEMKTYSRTCLLALGFFGKVGGVKAGNYLAGEVGGAAAGAAANATGLARTALNGVVGASNLWKNPYTTALMAPFAVQGLFAECECKKGH